MAGRGLPLFVRSSKLGKTEFVPCETWVRLVFIRLDVERLSVENKT